MPLESMTTHTVVGKAGRGTAESVSKRSTGTTTGRAPAVEPPLLLTNEEAAALLGIGRTTLYQLVWSGKLTPLRIGRSVRFTREQLREFVAHLSETA